MQQRQPLSFGGLRLDATGAQLRQGTQEIALRPKAFAVLTHLVEHAAQLVTPQLVGVEPVGHPRGVDPEDTIEERRGCGDPVARLPGLSTERARDHRPFTHRTRFDPERVSRLIGHRRYD